MPRYINFVDTQIRSIKSDAKRCVYWCHGCPGFGLRVTPSGKKTFVFKYMAGRITRWLTIGSYPKCSIRQARKEYFELYERVYDYGEDPVVQRKEIMAARGKEETVRSFTKTYLELGRLREKASIDDEERYFKRDIWPVIGELTLRNVTPADIEKIQYRILERSRTRARATRGGRVATKHAVACVRRLFNLAVKKGKCKVNPVLEIDALGVSGKRDRLLTLREIYRFWHGLESSGTPPVTVAALKFALVTMQRSNEIRNMRWDSVKADEKVWQLGSSETKNRTMHRVPLNEQALALIEAVHPYTEACPYIFGATRAKVPPQILDPDLIPLGKSALSQAIRRNREDWNIEDFCPHDLRRTGATWITAVGLPKLYARLMLNHSDGDRDVTGEVYVQYSYDFEKKRAAQVWQFVLGEIIHAKSEEEIPDLDTLREKVRSSGLL